MSKPTPISVTLTEAYENFSEYLNLAHYKDQDFIVLKRGKPFARIIAAGEDKPDQPTKPKKAVPAKPSYTLVVPFDPTQIAAEFKANELRLAELESAELVRVVENGQMVLKGEAEVEERRQRRVFRTSLRISLSEAIRSAKTLPSVTCEAAPPIPVSQSNPVSEPQL